MDPTRGDIDIRETVTSLLARLTERLPALERLLERSSSASYEDSVYHFYHQSFKVYALQALAPDRRLNAAFMQIVAEGTGKTFQPEHNERWPTETRPILEAFFHARYFLEMAVRYGSALDFAPNALPSGWAALLYLYDPR